jgi:hypothetical protein
MAVVAIAASLIGGRMHTHNRRLRLRLNTAVVLSTPLLLCLVGPIDASTTGTRSFAKATRVRTVNPAASAVEGGPAEPGVGTINEFRPRPRKPESRITGSKSVAHVPSKNVPRPGVSVVQDATATSGFNGLNHFLNRTAGSGIYANTQFSLEPPDQALCVSDLYVVESVNTVVRVRDKATGAALTPAIPINQFFGLAPSVRRTAPPVFGPFTADPKCYWDADTGAWFLTILSLGVNPATGAFTGASSVLVAVSTSPNPTGSWNIYEIVTTTDGNAGNCPCLGDQPLIGADANGFFISTNVFPLFEPGFNGAMVYALSKTALAAGGSPTVVKFFQPTLAEGFAYSLQPTTTPPGAAHATLNSGTEYFLSALDFTGSTDNRIAMWAMTNTLSLSSPTPSPVMHVTVLDSLTYGQPPAVLQKAGPTPLRDLLFTDLAVDLGLVTKRSREHLSTLDSNDDRMNQTVYVNGQVWGAVNTVVKGPTGPTRTAIAWFVVEPEWDAGMLGGSVASEGYVSVAGNSVMFPAVAANKDGEGIIAFSLAGPGVYPSAAYVTLDPDNGTGPVRVVRSGAGPADGFTGYLALGGDRTERWGDYSAAVADPAGALWFATEYIDSACTLDEFIATGFVCSDVDRTLFANWGTWIAVVEP